MGYSSASGGTGGYSGTGGGEHKKRGVFGLLNNLGSDVKDAVVGIPTGAVQIVKHPVGSAKVMGRAMWHDWKPLIEGHPIAFAKQTYDHPLAPLLDVATVFSAGAGISAKLADAAATAGSTSKLAEATAALGRSGSRSVSDVRAIAEGRVPRPDLIKTHGAAAGANLRRELANRALLHLEPHLPSWFKQTAREGRLYDRLHHVDIAHRGAATNLQINAMMRAGKTIADPSLQHIIQPELLSHNYWNFRRYAHQHDVTQPLPKGYRYVKEMTGGEMFAAKDGVELESRMRTFGNDYTTTRVQHAAKVSGGKKALIVPKQDIEALSREGEHSTRFLRTLAHKPVTIWKRVNVGYAPRVVTNNAIGNWAMHAMRTGGESGGRGFIDAVKYAHGNRAAMRAFKDMHAAIASGEVRMAPKVVHQADKVTTEPYTLDRFLAERPAVPGYSYHGSPEGDLGGHIEPYSRQPWREGDGFYTSPVRGKADAYAAGKTARGERKGLAGSVNYIKLDPKAKVLDLEKMSQDDWRGIAEHVFGEKIDPKTYADWARDIRPEEMKTASHGVLNRARLMHVLTGYGEMPKSDAYYAIEDALHHRGVQVTRHTESGVPVHVVKDTSAIRVVPPHEVYAEARKGGYLKDTVTREPQAPIEHAVSNEEAAAHFTALAHPSITADPNMAAITHAFGKRATDAVKRPPDWVRQNFSDELGNVFGNVLGDNNGKGSKLVKQGFYPIVHRVADEPVRVAALYQFMRRSPEVKAFLKTHPGATLDESIQTVLKKNPGKLRERAVAHVRSIAGDYTSMNPAEKLIQNIVPFYLWDKHIAKHFANMVSEKPGRVVAMQQVSRMGEDETKKLLGDVPGFLQGALPLSLFGMSKHGDRTPVLGTQGANPYSTIGDLASTATALITRHDNKSGGDAASELSPILTGLIEQIQGHKIGSHAPAESHGGVIPSMLADTALGTSYGTLLKRLIGGTPKPANGKPTLYEKTPQETAAGLFGLPIKNVNLTRAAEMAAQDAGTKKKKHGYTGGGR